MPRSKALVLVPAALALCGCTVGRDYHAPDAPAVTQWVEADAARISSARADLASWWKVLGDPLLDELMQRAAAQGLDVEEAALRVREARAERAMAGAADWPTLDAEASYANSRLSKNGFLKGLVQGGGIGGAPGSVVPGKQLNLWEVGFDASWEIDVFGRTARAEEAADADFAAALAGQNEVLVTLLAEVARDYVTVRGLQHRRDVTQRTIRAQGETLALTRERFAAGVANDLDVARAEALVATTQAQVPVLESLCNQTMHGLEVLLGEPPGALRTRLEALAPIPAPPAEAAIGLPAELLRRRPDLRRAEREVAAATARIGVATADLYPRFTLSGAFGLQSQDAGDLALWASRFWSLGPAIRWPILAGGRIRAGIDAQEARAAQAVVRYQRAVLGALRDVENALVAYGHEQERHAALLRAVAADQRALDMANQLQSNGVIDFLSVLDAQRSLYDAQDQLARSEQDLTTDLIALYKALGGGWQLPAGTAPS